MKTNTAIVLLSLSVAFALTAQPPALQSSTPPSPAPSGLGQALESPAAQIDKVLPSWLIFGGDYRSRFEGYSGGSFKHNTTDDYLLSRLKLRLTIAPTSWMKFFIEGMDARALEKTPAVPTYQNTWDIRQAYAEIGDFEKGIFGLRAGRQEFTYGDERLIGPSAWTNTEHSFDAIRGTARYKGYRLDLFASSIVNPVTGTWDHHLQGNNLHGAYGGIDKLGPRLVIEPYVLWRLEHGLKNEENVVSKLNEKIGGLRIVGKQLPGGLDYGMEVVREFGSLGSDKIQSWAGHWVAGRTTNIRFTPRVYAEYNYAGGDQKPTDGIRGTFDQLYPSGHDKMGFDDQVGWRNIKDLRAGLGTKPRRNATAVFEYNNWYLASATDALYNAAGTAVFRSTAGSAGTAGTHVGQEFDVTGTWTFAKAFTAGAGVGHILPGQFLKTVTPGNPYTYPYMMIAYKF
jgi:hypothetical protein